MAAEVTTKHLLLYNLNTAVSVSEMFTNLRNGSIVPNVAFMWENIGNKPQLALLHILLNWVQEVFCCNLKINCIAVTLKRHS